MEIANKLDKFYPTQYKLQPNQKKKLKIHRKQKGANRGDGHLEELYTKELTMEELKEAIKNISNKKQPGPDKIFPEFIKNLGLKAIDILLLIYNKFWTSKMSLPADWTKGVFILILKQGKPTRNGIISTNHPYLNPQKLF